MVDPWLQPADPPPEFDIRGWVPTDPLDGSFESEDDAATRKTERTKILQNGDERHCAVAREIGACFEEEPCGQPFDPVCARIWRTNYVWRAAQAIHAHFPGAPLTMATLVPERGQFNPGKIDRFSIPNHQNLLRTHLNRSNLGHVLGIGGNDVSFDEDAAKEWPPRWQWHDHILFIGANKEQITDGLERYYPTTNTIPEPIRVTPVTDLLGALSYTYKSVFFRRVSIFDGRGHRNTLPPKRIHAPQLRELALFLSTTSYPDRLFLRGFRRLGGLLVPTPKGD